MNIKKFIIAAVAVIAFVLATLVIITVVLFARWTAVPALPADTAKTSSQRVPYTAYTAEGIIKWLSDRNRLISKRVPPEFLKAFDAHSNAVLAEDWKTVYSFFGEKSPITSNFELFASGIKDSVCTPEKIMIVRTYSRGKATGIPSKDEPRPRPDFENTFEVNLVLCVLVRIEDSLGSEKQLWFQTEKWEKIEGEWKVTAGTSRWSPR